MITNTLVKYELVSRALPTITSEAQLDDYQHALIQFDEQRHSSAEEKQYARVLAALIEKYEREHYSSAQTHPLEMLAYLIDENGLRQRDLVDVLGPESVVSEIVNGKRPLSKTNIEKLSRRFKVSPALFFEIPR